MNNMNNMNYMNYMNYMKYIIYFILFCHKDQNSILSKLPKDILKIIILLVKYDWIKFYERFNKLFIIGKYNHPKSVFPRQPIEMLMNRKQTPKHIKDLLIEIFIDMFDFVDPNKPNNTQNIPSKIYLKKDTSYLLIDILNKHLYTVYIFMQSSFRGLRYLAFIEYHPEAVKDTDMYYSNVENDTKSVDREIRDIIIKNEKSTRSKMLGHYMSNPEVFGQYFDQLINIWKEMRNLKIQLYPIYFGINM